MLARYSAIKTNQCTGTGKWSCNVLLISEDTGPGSVGVWPRRSSSLVRSSAQHNWAVAASCCSPTIFLLRYTPTCNTPPKPHSLILPFSRQTDCHGLQPTHSCSSAVMRVPIQKAFILPVTGQHTGWQTGALHKDNVGQTCVCVFACACVVVSTFTWIR